ncbi:MAG: pitrilysin family protein, partial [bacterium]|nr:pitrilysin family protein [bacterium]
MHSPVPERHTLDNGIQVLAESMPGAQSVVVMFRFPFGAQEDPIDRLGMASVAEDTLFKGTPDKDARAVFDTFDALGVRRGSAASVEYTEFQAQLLPRHLEETLRLYAEVFRNASFPDDQVDVSKALALEELKRLEDNPAQQVMYKTYQAGLGDPMGRLPLGEMGTVATIAPPDVRTFWTKFCGPEHLIISMAGGLDAQQMFDAVEAAFGDWPMDGREAGQVHPVSVASRYVHQSKQSQQAHIGMLFGSVPRGHELYYSGQLTIAVLSGSGSS